MVVEPSPQYCVPRRGTLHACRWVVAGVAGGHGGFTHILVATIQKNAVSSGYTDYIPSVNHGQRQRAGCIRCRGVSRGFYSRTRLYASKSMRSPGYTGYTRSHRSPRFGAVDRRSWADSGQVTSNCRSPRSSPTRRQRRCPRCRPARPMAPRRRSRVPCSRSVACRTRGRGGYPYARHRRLSTVW